MQLLVLYSPLRELGDFTQHQSRYLDALEYILEYICMYRSSHGYLAVLGVPAIGALGALGATSKRM